MLKFIQNLLSNKSGPSENEDFIRLVQIMRDDSQFKTFVMAVIDKDATERNSFLDKQISDLRNRKVPEEHIEIFTFLREQKICDQIKSLLEKGDS